MGEGWAFVGRSAELRLLRRCLGDVAARGLVLSGEAGVGKTRLAVECLAMAEQKGMATLRITATRAGSAIPFGALATLFPTDRPGADGPGDDGADQLRHAAEALLTRAAGRRLVLLVDDAHLLDGASATLIHSLAMVDKMFVLATVRAGEPAPDPVVALWKDGLTERIEIRGLDVETIEELLTAALEGPVDPGTMAHLAIRCQGNVLLLRELVLGALGEGALSLEEGIWRLVAPYSPSSRLVELVEGRLQDLPPAERSLLELVSLGEPLGSLEVERLGGDLAMAEELERSGLLACRMDGRRLEIRLAHPVYGDVLRARMPALRRASLVRALAETVEASGTARREDTLRVATWRLEGGGGSPELLLSAAVTARWRYDLPLSERLARAALTLGAGFQAALLAAQTASLQGKGLEAEAELAELDVRAADEEQRALVALARLDNSAFYLGSSAEALRIAEEAEATITDLTWSAEIAARRVAVTLGTDGPRAAAALADELLQRAGTRPLTWAASMTASYSLGRLGRVDEALDVAERALAAHETGSIMLDWYPWVHVWCRCEVLASAGRCHEAEQLATEHHDNGIKEHSLEEQAWFAWTLTELFITRGHVNKAIAHGREAVALFRALGRTLFLSECLVHLAGALALAGRVEEASQAVANFEALGLPPNRYSAVDLGQARAWIAAVEGDLPRARRLLEAAVELGHDRGDLVGEAAALHGLARIGHPEAAADRLSALSEQLEGPLAAARACHALALRRRDPEGLEAVSTRFAECGADLLAAESAADAAIAWRKKGEARRAAAIERRARTHAERCEGAATPALQLLGQQRPLLTQAEREAALLAAGGRSNKEIAQELSLSVRTVEGQLQRVYEKLGISTRAALVEALEGRH